MQPRRRRVLETLGVFGITSIAGCSTLSGDETDSTLPSTQVSKLAADYGNSLTRFGLSVEVSGDGSTAIVGAFGDEDPNGQKAGSAFVFSRIDGSWTQEAKLVANGGDENDQFGHAVAIADDGSVIIIGAPGNEDPNGPGAGSAYVFSRINGSWSQEAKLSADDGDANDQFGHAVSMAGDGSIAIIGAPNDEDPNGESSLQRNGESSLFAGAGSAYVFSRAGESWSQEAKLVADDGDENDQFGRAVAMAGDGSVAIIGTPLDEDPNDPSAGSAYVFSRMDESWSQQVKLAADDGYNDDRFGVSVAVSDDGSVAIIGSPLDEEPNVSAGSAHESPNAGSAYVFSRAGESWSQEAKLRADDADGMDWLGVSVAMSCDGSIAIIGAMRRKDGLGPSTGSAYVFA